MNEVLPCSLQLEGTEADVGYDEFRVFDGFKIEVAVHIGNGFLGRMGHLNCSTGKWIIEPVHHFTFDGFQ